MTDLLKKYSSLFIIRAWPETALDICPAGYRLFHHVGYNEYIKCPETHKRLRVDEDKKKDNSKHKQGTVDFFTKKMTPLTPNNPRTHATTTFLHVNKRYSVCTRIRCHEIVSLRNRVSSGINHIYPRLSSIV